LDRPAIAKPLSLDRAAIPETARERVAWLEVATSGIGSAVPERFSPAQRCASASAQRPISSHLPQETQHFSLLYGLSFC
jgi:hypothetical protein